METLRVCKWLFFFTFIYLSTLYAQMRKFSFKYGGCKLFLKIHTHFQRTIYKTINANEIVLDSVIITIFIL